MLVLGVLLLINFTGMTNKSHEKDSSLLKKNIGMSYKFSSSVLNWLYTPESDKSFLKNSMFKQNSCCDI